MHKRMHNEAALRIASKALAVIRPALRDEEAGDAYREFYEIALEEVGRFHDALVNMNRKLNPLENRQ